MLIDTHVHYNLEPLFSNQLDHSIDDIVTPSHWKTHWQKAQQAGVTHGIVVGTNVATSFRALEIAKQADDLYPTVGIHPIEVPGLIEKYSLYSDQSIGEFFASEVRKIESLLDLHSAKIVAVGEIGLDYYRLDRNDLSFSEITHRQKQIFSQQLQLAKVQNLPIICHVRDKEFDKKNNSAYWDALEILREFEVSRFVLHCVSGPMEYVQSAIELGGYVGFDGNVTYPNAKDVRSLLKLAPQNRILLETDAPFLPPNEYRGQVCEPWMITKTAQFLDREYGLDSDTMTENAQELFSLLVS